MTKLYLYLRANFVEDFIRGDYCLCLNISDRTPDEAFESWMHIGEVDVEIDVDEKKVRQVAIDRLNNEIGVKRAIAEKEIERLETRKKNLLAITHEVEK